MNISVSIVDSDAQAGLRLHNWIRRAQGFRCISTHTSGESALREIPSVRPEVVVIDSNLHDTDGIECVRHLKRQLPNTQFVIFSALEEIEYIRKAFQAGANGYLTKDASREQLLAAIREVHTGGSPLSNSVGRKITQTFHRPHAAHLDQAGLSPRQLEILELLTQGYKFSEIASLLLLERTTVVTHALRMYKKLNVNSRAKAVAAYLKTTDNGLPRRSGA